MSPRKARTPETAILPKAKVHLQADISVNGAGYGSWRPDEPGAPPLARRIAILLGHIERVWKDAPMRIVKRCQDGSSRFGSRQNEAPRALPK